MKFFLLFEECISFQRGGAIFVSINSNFQILINESTFYKCKSLYDGGSLYIYAYYLIVHLKKKCITNSSIDSLNSNNYGSTFYLKS